VIWPSEWALTRSPRCSPTRTDMPLREQLSDRGGRSVLERLIGVRMRRKKQSSAGVPLPSGEWIDPSRLRFSLPTICDEIPASTADPAAASDVLIHEDDWRQFELVALIHRKAILDNFAAIHEITSESTGVGFDRIHVREEPRLPLRGLDVRRGQLTAGLGPSFSEPVGVAFRSQPARLPGAFAYVGPSSTLYGIDYNGVLMTVGVLLTGHSDGPDAGVAALMQLADQLDACVVDWLAAQSYPNLTVD
jgi:hypothetical protein